MRPPRIIIAGAFFLTAVFLTFLSLRSSHPEHTIASASVPKAGVQAFFSFRAPFSLFPPNAVITLTHDNTTAFLARPADFGPSLPSDGLKGQLWIGSGFGDDSIRLGPVISGAEGELGCSDVPGFVDTFSKSSTAASEEVKAADSKSATVLKSKSQRRSNEDGPFDDQTAELEDPLKDGKGETGPSVDDGTDDYLHDSFAGSTVSKITEKHSADSKADHADIQSIQEGAEITGKVVLLSRGGCGFLEKVKWAQRRGAIALIVGDDTAGGALIRMYARGDTSNVTIPSIFTSRTTAHLLSSLIGHESYIEDTLDENGKPQMKAKHAGKKAVKKQGTSRSTFTPAAVAAKATVTPRAASKSTRRKGSKHVDDTSAIKTERPGWFKSLFFGPGKASTKPESSRPPSSGELDWVLVDDWKDDRDSKTKKISTRPKKSESLYETPEKGKAGLKPSSGDDFVIGVQDWRDPDLVGSKDGETGGKANPGVDGKPDPTRKNDKPLPTKGGGKKHADGINQYDAENEPTLRGGSITPGSGEYGLKDPAEEDAKETEDPKDSSKSSGKSLLTAIFGDDEENVELPGSVASSSGKNYNEGMFSVGDDEKEGLWVTLTPTSGASPFLDTLLVLVVSPLVTLTVVYALLLIRSRIRRRRWRAPKSVVERLPVRTYQTIVGSGTQSPRIPSPTGSSVTTPLLQSSPASGSRPRPRSRTTTGIPEPGDLIRVNSSPLQVPGIPARVPEHEKNSGDSSEWKKYMGRQVECVVCLEEYVDGVSRVMSLPCGHEFHVDCITPWLTTRRRTCPICKGDVVRSLARGSPSSPRYEAYHDDSDDDIQVQAAETVNNSSTAALPIAGSIDDDLEQGTASTPTRPSRANRSGSWRTLLASSLGSSSRSPRPPQEDRNR